VSQFIAFGIVEGLWSVSVFQLEHRPAIGAASGMEKPLPEGSGNPMAKGGRGEIHQKGLASRAHQDIPVVDVSLGDARLMDRVDQLQEFLEEFDRDLAGTKMRQVVSLHKFHGKSQGVHLSH